MIKSFREQGSFDKALALEVLVEELLKRNRKCLVIFKKNRGDVQQEIISCSEIISLLNILASSGSFTSIISINKKL